MINPKLQLHTFYCANREGTELNVLQTSTLMRDTANGVHSPCVSLEVFRRTAMTVSSLNIYLTPEDAVDLANALILKYGGCVAERDEVG